MNSRLFDLKSSWLLPAAAADVWAIIADPNMSWPTWWPHCSFAGPLERTKPATHSTAELLEATTAFLDFKAPLGYTLTISVHPTKVDTPNEIEFDAGADLVGTGRVTLTPEAFDKTLMGIEWRVRPTQRWMAILSPVAASAFKAAHTRMMRQGEQGLIKALARQETEI